MLQPRWLSPAPDRCSRIENWFSVQQPLVSLRSKYRVLGRLCTRLKALSDHLTVLLADFLPWRRSGNMSSGLVNLLLKIA